jgi:four helix bundle suffix protein
MGDTLIPRHGGYRHLKSFQVAQLVYDVTVRFCDCYINKRSRTHDQMVQAARSGVQNIAEGSVASGTSKKTELKLTNVARASLEELRLDYEDFLRQRGLAIWDRHDARRAGLISRRPANADAVAAWAREVRAEGRQDGHDGQRGHDGHDGHHGQHGRDGHGGHHGQHGRDGHGGQHGRDGQSTMSTVSMSTMSTPSYPEIAANGALALIAVASALLGRQISTLEKAFAEEGGFTERLYRFRTKARNSTPGKRR